MANSAYQCTVVVHCTFVMQEFDGQPADIASAGAPSISNPLKKRKKCWLAHRLLSFPASAASVGQSTLFTASNGSGSEPRRH